MTLMNAILIQWHLETSVNKTTKLKDEEVGLNLIGYTRPTNSNAAF